MEEEPDQNLRDRIVEVVEPIDGEIAINRIVYLIEGTFMEDGEYTFNYGSWERSTGEGIPFTTFLGMMEYLKIRASKNIMPMYADDDEDGE